MKNNKMSNETPPVNKRIKKKNIRKAEDKTKMIRIDEADHEWIKEKAFQERLTMKDMVTTLIEQYQ